MANLLNEKFSFSIPTGKNFGRKKIFLVLFWVILFLSSYFFLLSAPADFPPDASVRVLKGMNLREISLELKEQKMIRSRIAFEAFVILYGGEKRIISSDYLFVSKVPVYEVARRIAQGEHKSTRIVVTIPEGYDVNQISEAFSLKLPEFNKNLFLTKATEKEGYLFPDTYYFSNTDNENTVFFSMTNNYNKKIKTLLPEIISSGKKEEDIIIMASIVEREAKGDADREVISGILWKRLSIGMPLQVDAAPLTYKMKGLPAGPISNPGLLAIKAAIFPLTSPYLYYLHDKEGEIHYARTFKEHVANKKKYLSNTL